MMGYFVYIMASKRNGTLYIGVTNDLARRACEHRTGAIEGFSRMYSGERLVWYERHPDIETAIAAKKRSNVGRDGTS